VRTLVNELIKELVKVRVHKPIKIVEVRFKAWNNVSDNGVDFYTLSNKLVMFGAHLLILFVELLGMSIGDLKLGCRLRVLCHGMFEQCHVVRESIRR
jgi:hypothetical protein